MATSRDLALFFGGVEAFHTLSHAYFALSGTDLKPFGIPMTRSWHAGAALLNGIAAIGLLAYAGRRPAPIREERRAAPREVASTAIR